MSAALQHRSDFLAVQYPNRRNEATGFLVQRSGMNEASESSSRVSFACPDFNWNLVDEFKPFRMHPRGIREKPTIYT